MGAIRDIAKEWYGMHPMQKIGAYMVLLAAINFIEPDMGVAGVTVNIVGVPSPIYAAVILIMGFSGFSLMIKPKQRRRYFLALPLLAYCAFVVAGWVVGRFSTAGALNFLFMYDLVMTLNLVVDNES